VSTHEDFRRENGAETGSNRSFGYVFTVVFLVIALLPLYAGEPFREWSLGCAVVIFLISLARPSMLSPFNKLWGRLGHLMGRIVNPVVLGIMFYGIISPTGLIMRLAGKDPLRLQIDPSTKSYWIPRVPPGPAPDTMKNQF
jgi:hypothetical protein